MSEIRKEDFHTCLGKIMWMMQTRPSVCFESSFSGQMVQCPEETDGRRLNKSLRSMKASSNHGLKLRGLDLTRGVCLHVFVDASFANMNLKTQGGVAIFIGPKSDYDRDRKSGPIIHRDEKHVAFEKLPASLLTTTGPQ